MVLTTYLYHLEHSDKNNLHITFFYYTFKFWGTCADRVGLLHWYTPALVVCCIHPSSSTLGVSPNVILTQPPDPLLCLP